MIALQTTDRLAVGFGPTVDIFGLSLDPAFFAANPDSSFPSATHGRPFWGAGFQTGLYYELNPCWSFGVSYKSPQWFERFRWNALDHNGSPREIDLNLTLPSIVSWGAAYRGFERTTLAADVRYFDYAGTDTFGDAPADGGTGWQSIFAAAPGAQVELGERMKLRLGYLYNENPIPQAATLFNVQLPGFNQHQLSVGFGMQLTPKISMDFSWVHVFDASIEGPILPTQAVNTRVRLEQSMDTWGVGLGVNF